MKYILPILIVLALLVWGLSARYPDAIATSDEALHVTYSVLLLTFLLSSVVVRYQRRMKIVFAQLLLVALIIVVLLIGYSFRFELKDIKDRVVAELVPSRAVSVSSGEVSFRASQNGHYYIDAYVNAEPVRFMVDTGASDVVLDRDVATRLGFDVENLRFDKLYRTANGMGRGAAVTLEEVTVGDITIRNVRASINQTPIGTSLLGMSFLDELESYEVTRDRLILRK